MVNKETLVSSIDKFISDINNKLSEQERNELLRIRTGLAEATQQTVFEQWFIDLLQFILLAKDFYDLLK